MNQNSLTKEGFMPEQYIHNFGESIIKKRHTPQKSRQAPYKCALISIAQNEEFELIIKELTKQLKKLGISCKTDSSVVSLGKKYARADELGVPFSITVDKESLHDQTAILREIETVSQVRISVSEVPYIIQQLINDQIQWNDVLQQYPHFMFKDEESQSGVYYSIPYIKARGNTILKQLYLYEKCKNYLKVWTTIKEILPIYEKFSHNKRTNLTDEDKSVFKLYCTLLFHAGESCRLMKKKEEMLDVANTLVDIFRRIGITYENIKKIEKEEFKQQYIKWYSMLSRALYWIGKSQFKVGFEKMALRSLYKSMQISELVFGEEDIKSMKCRDKYEKLSQKLEFDMLINQDQIDFQQFKSDLNQESLPESMKNFNPKPNKDFNHHILKQVKSYEQIVRQLSYHSSKYQMPEYVKKVREEYENKLRGMSDSKQTVDTQFSKYIIKRKTNPQSRATSTHLEKMFSPRTQMPVQSHRVSMYQNLMFDKMDLLKDQLKELDTKKQSINDLLIARPQLKSDYQKSTKVVKINTTQQIEGKRGSKPLIQKSQRSIARPLMRQPTQQAIKTETQSSEQQRLRQGQTMTVDPLQEEQEQIDIETQQQQFASQQKSSPQVTPLNVFQNIKTEFSEGVELDNNYKFPIQILNEAATKIQTQFRRWNSAKQKQQTLQSEVKLKSRASINLPESLELSNKNSMKMSIKDVMKTSMKRNKGFAIGSIIKDFKTNESELSYSKAKRLVEVLVDFSKLDKLKMHFVDLLFFDTAPTFWTISNMSLRAYSQLQSKSMVFNNEDFQQNTLFNNNEQYSEELQFQINHIYNIFSNQLSMKSLALNVYITLSNCNQQYTMYFKIQNFVSYLDEYDKWFFKDQFLILDALLSIYCKQQNLFPKKDCEKIILIENENFEIAESLIGKLIYLLKNHFFLVKKQVGYKLVPEMVMQEREYQNECINVQTIRINSKTQRQNKRLLKSIMLHQENIRYFDIQHKWNVELKPNPKLHSIQILEEGQDSSFYVIKDPELLSYKQSSSIHDNEYQIIAHSSQNFQYDPIIKTHDSPDLYKPMINRQKQRQSTAIQNRLEIVQKPYQAPSQTVIKSTTLSLPKALSPSSFGGYIVDKGKEKIKEESHSYSVLNSSDIEYFQAFFPEFKIGTKQQVEEYQLGEIYDITRPFQQHQHIQCFKKQGQIIRPEPTNYEDEYPTKFLIISYLVKLKDSLSMYQLEKIESNLIINSGEDNQQLDIQFVDPRIPNKEERLAILQQLTQLSQYVQIIEEQEIILDNALLIQQLNEYNSTRYITLLINRIASRIMHYDDAVMKEVNEAIYGNITNHVLQDLLIYGENSVKLKFQMDTDLQSPLSPTSPVIVMTTKVEKAVGDMISEETQNDQFSYYRTKFQLKENKFLLQYEQNNTIIYVKIEFKLRDQRQKDTGLAYLSNQQAKQEQIFLKKGLQQLITQEQTFAYIKIYNSNTNVSQYRMLYNQKDLNKVAHLMNFNKKKIFKFLFKTSALKEQRIIGDSLQIKHKMKSLEEHNLDKFSEVDQFLLLYIQNPMMNLTNLNNQEQLRLKQTLLFYLFKQQLKLTLISSSYQRFFMRTYFHQKVFYAQSRVSNIGKVFVEARVYQFNQFYLIEESIAHTYFYFQIIPQKGRTKVFKLIMDLADITSVLFHNVNQQNCFNDQVLREIIRKLTSYLVCYRTNTYNSIKIPLSYISSQSNYDLLNSFREVTFGSNILVSPKSPEKMPFRSNKSQPKLSLIITGTEEKRSYDRKHSKSSEYDKMLQIESLAFPQEASRILRNTTMLTPMFRGQKIIYKTTKVIQNVYIIFTVSYNILGSFQLGVYIPQTCRTFSTFLRQSDFQNMDPNFLESIFPSQFVSKSMIDQFFMNRWKFNEINKIYDMATNHPEDFEDNFSDLCNQARAIPQIEYQKLTESKISIKEDEEIYQDKLLILPDECNSSDSYGRMQGRASTQPPIFIKKQYTKQMSIQSAGMRKSTQLQVPQNSIIQKSHFYKNYSPRPSQNSLDLSTYQNDKDLFYNTLLVRKKNMDIIASFEIKIWEQLLNRISISKNKQNRYILHLDTFKGVLKESLFSQTIYLGNESNAFYEVYIENNQKPKDIFKSFVPLRLSESTQYVMYQRITFYEKPRVVNIKMMLRKPLYQYYNDEKWNLQNQQFKANPLETYEFILADFKLCAVYMLNRLKKVFMQTNTCNLQDVEGDQKCPQLFKTNVSFTQVQQYMKASSKVVGFTDVAIKDPNKSPSKKYQLLIRRVLTLNQTISIFYREKRNKFFINIWNSKNSKQITIKFTLQEIQLSIPSALSLLNLGLVLELGNRIYLSFKNKLLIQSYQQMGL